MTNDAWESVDRYFSDLLIPADPMLAAVLRANQEAGLPAMDVAPNQGKLLMLLARISGARRVLEIGTLGAYSTIWLARGIPTDGRIVTLEADPSYAAVARANLDRAGVADRVDLRVAPALDTLPELLAQDAGPFDLVFIDADKPNNPHYLEWALRLTRPGSLVIGDNVVRDGHVVDPDSPDDRVRGVRTFLEMTGADPRLDATALQTVGAKGWDGFSLAVVR
ncbi:O-methyltransferase [Polymorphospora sp. NPDC051019]|uniref:O-methyltransferase n=1 Tax=Polymorphospora sp. NPDC051019 TaxID=3155725 RepID=UPI003444DFB3